MYVVNVDIYSLYVTSGTYFVPKFFPFLLISINICNILFLYNIQFNGSIKLYL